MDTFPLLSAPTPATVKQEYLAPYSAKRGLSAMPPSVSSHVFSPRFFTAPTR